MRKLLLALGALALPSLAAAHGMRTAYLDVVEQAGGRATLRLTTSAPFAGLAVPPPDGCRAEDADADPLVVDCAGGLAGRTLRVDGLGPIVSELVVHVAFADGREATRTLSERSPSWPLAPTGAAAVLAGYARMGLVHIATGGDHLLFLAALAVALRRLRAILAAETAFTASHTITFTASALGWIRVAPAAAEACIAASLVLAALDAAAPDEKRMRTAGAAALAFAFGLVHGLGFAGGLAEIGLPDRAIGWALAGFAVGVEAGQVAFLLAVVGALRALEQSRRGARLIRPALAYAVGGTGAFLLFERLAALFRGA